MSTDLSSLRLLADVNFLDGTVPSHKSGWLHIEWFGRSRWVTYTEVMSGRAWRHWYDLMSGPRKPTTYTRYVLRYSYDHQVLPREPTREETRRFADPSRWRAYKAHQKEFLICPVCHFEYQYPTYHRDHVRWHARWIEATGTVGYEPAGRVERQQMLSRGHRLLEAENLREGAMLIIQAHFDRSLIAAIEWGYWARHPTFMQYLAMVDGGIGIPDEMWHELHQQHGSITGEIAYGQWQWLPKPDKRDGPSS